MRAKGPIELHVCTDTQHDDPIFVKLSINLLSLPLFVLSLSPSSLPPLSCRWYSPCQKPTLPLTHG